MQCIDTYVQSDFRFILIDLCCLNDEVGGTILLQEALSYSTYCRHPGSNPIPFSLERETPPPLDRPSSIPFNPCVQGHKGTRSALLLPLRRALGLSALLNLLLPPPSPRCSSPPTSSTAT